MKRSPLADPDDRRDALIVIGLFALGLLLNVALWLAVLWLLQAVGFWDGADWLTMRPPIRYGAAVT